MKTRLVRFLQKSLLAFCGVLIACLSAEILLRLFDYEGLSLMKKDPVLGQKYSPNLEKRIYEEESGRWVDIKINALGFRDKEHTPGESSKKRVVILGDSFAAGFSMKFEHTFPQLIQKYLDAASDEDWEVLNLGIAGFGTAQELLAYTEYGRKFHPDFVVLCFFAGNDVSDNSSELSTNPRVYFRLTEEGKLVREPASRLRSRASDFLNENSRFYLWQKTQIKKLEHYYKSSIGLNPAHKVFLAHYDERLMRAWNITFALIREIQSQVSRDGAELLTVYIPFSDEVNSDWWKETIDSSPPMQQEKWEVGKAERMLSDFCKNNRLDYFSPRSIFIQETAGTGARFYFKHGHFNENGHRRIAELITHSILQ